MEAYRGRRGIALLILNLGTGGQWLTSRLGCFVLGKNPGTHLTGGCVGPTASLDVSEKRKKHLIINNNKVVYGG
jgi:hypothetical protein